VVGVTVGERLIFVVEGYLHCAGVLGLGVIIRERKI
jgi:hypothetical protein